MDKNDNAQHMGGPSFAPYLEKIAFPQSREAILKLADENEADQDIRDRMAEIPERTYNSIEDLRRALGDVYENYGATDKQAH
jgi:hypothetical protein